MNKLALVALCAVVAVASGSVIRKRGIIDDGYGLGYDLSLSAHDGSFEHGAELLGGADFGGNEALGLGHGFLDLGIGGFGHGGISHSSSIRIFHGGHTAHHSSHVIHH